MWSSTGWPTPRNESGEEMYIRVHGHTRSLSHRGVQFKSPQTQGKNSEHWCYISEGALRTRDESQCGTYFKVKNSAAEKARDIRDKMSRSCQRSCYLCSHFLFILFTLPFLKRLCSSVDMNYKRITYIAP